MLLKSFFCCFVTVVLLSSTDAIAQQPQVPWAITAPAAGANYFESSTIGHGGKNGTPNQQIEIILQEQGGGIWSSTVKNVGANGEWIHNFVPNGKWPLGANPPVPLVAEIIVKDLSLPPLPPGNQVVATVTINIWKDLP